MRSRLLLVPTLLVALFAVAGCSNQLRPQREFTIQVTGNHGTPLTGVYILTVGGRTTREPIDREVPFTIQVSGHDVSAQVQKLGASGTVRVQLSVNGTPVDYAFTTEDYGNISVATP